MDLRELVIYGLFKMNSKDLTINFKNEYAMYTTHNSDYFIKTNSHTYMFTFNTDLETSRILCNDLLEIETGKKCKIYCTEEEIKTYITLLIKDYIIYLKDNQLVDTLSNLLIDIFNCNIYDIDFKISVK